MKLPPRHGLTLLELLIALALTGAMAVSLAQWVSTAANMSVRCEERAATLGPTLAFFQMIQEDLDAVTFPAKNAAQQSGRRKAAVDHEERVRVDESGTTLSITTRILVPLPPSAMSLPSDAIARYRWDRPSAAIVREYLTIDGNLIQDTDRFVLAGVEKFECSIGDGQSPRLTLEVTINGSDAVKRSLQVR